jgi:putative hemolysin
MNNESKMWEAKDKRISFQSLFSTLCGTKGGMALEEIERIKKIAFDLNEELHAKYPTPAETTFQPQKPRQKAVNASNGEVMQCSNCGSTLKLVQAGISKKTGKAYTSFWYCPNNNTRGCKTVPYAPRLEDINENNYE